MQARRAHRLARRQWIQEAARGVFAEHGFDRSSIEQIARAAQLSVGSIYLYFRSKDDLCVSLIEDAMMRFDEQMSRLFVDAPAAEQLRAGWGLLMEWTRRSEYARVLRLLAEPTIRAQLSEEVLAAVSAGTGRIKELLAECVRHGVEAGRYRDVSEREVAELLWSMLLGCLGASGIQASLGEPPVPLELRAWQSFSFIERALARAERAAA